MRNDQAQTPTGGLDENDQNKSKNKFENSNNNKIYNKINNRHGENSRAA